jgi:hypothetical protein
MPKHDSRQQTVIAPPVPETAPVVAGTTAPAVEESSTPEKPAAVLAHEVATAAHRARSIAQAARIAAPLPAPKFAPRFAPGRQAAVPADVDPVWAKEGLLVIGGQARCARQSCGGGQGIDGLHNVIGALSGALGWVKYRDHWFCGSTCVNQEKSSPSITFRPSQPGAATGKPGAMRDPARVVLRNGFVHCDRNHCDACAHVGEGLSPEAAVQGAIACGYVQTDDGVFCGKDHAKKQRADIVAGIATPKTYSDAVAVQKAAIEANAPRSNA